MPKTTQSSPLIVYPEKFQDELNEKFQINPSDVYDAVKNPDRREAQQIDEELTLAFFVKDIPQMPEPYTLLVYGEQTAAAFEVSMAWKILPQVMPEAKQLAPIALLKEFANRFGLQITLGEHSRKIFFNTDILMSESSELAIENPEGHEYVQQIFTKSTSFEDIVRVHCALVMCIDIDLYRIKMMNA